MRSPLSSTRRPFTVCEFVRGMSLKGRWPMVWFIDSGGARIDPGSSHPDQISLFAGVFASCFAIGATLIGMNKALEKYVPVTIEADFRTDVDGIGVESTSFDHEGRVYTLINVIGSPKIPEGKYLVNPQTGKIEMQWIQGIGSDQAPAPLTTSIWNNTGTGSSMQY